MKIDQFIKDIEEEFEDLKKGVLQPDAMLADYFEWNSINALIMSAMIRTNYNVTITGEDFGDISTVESLYNIVMNRI